jgi:hypothetical protein
MSKAHPTTKTTAKPVAKKTETKSVASTKAPASK